VGIPIIAQDVEPERERALLTGYAEWARLLPDASHSPS